MAALTVEGVPRDPPSPIKNFERPDLRGNRVAGGDANKHYQVSGAPRFYYPYPSRKAGNRVLDREEDSADDGIYGVRRAGGGYALKYSGVAARKNGMGALNV